MLLKVGELAKRTGLTVRTLHHYDEIGLLMPSGRSDSGYRLYSREDVARLHGIQALRHLGLPLKDIAQLLEGRGAGPGVIIEQQIRALDQQIARAGELRGRLGLMRDRLVDGGQPDMADWLDTLSLMTTYGKYFSAVELKAIFQKFKPLESEWRELTAQVRALMDRGVPSDALEVHPLANRWMALMVRWMDGDMALLDRWSEMFRQEPSAHGRNNAPPTDMIEFISPAIEVRKALMGRYLTVDEMLGFGRVTVAEWRALEARVAALIAAGASPAGAPARAAARSWDGLVDRMAGSAAVRQKLQQAWTSEPVLAAGSSLSAPVRAFLAEVRAGPEKAHRSA